MLKKVLMIANPGSGKGDAPEYAADLSKVLKESYETEIDIRETTKVGDATDWAEAAKGEGYDTVICLGGDGTVNEVINGLMKVEEPPVFSFVPLGTANDLGRVLGFDMSAETAINQFANLEEDRIDIGQVNNHYFMDVVAVGDIPTAVMETDSDKKNKLGYLAYIVDSAKVIMDGDQRGYRVTDSKGEQHEFTSNVIVVALTSSVGGMENLIEHRVYNDGLFQFFALKGQVIASSITTLANAGGIPEEHTDNDTILAFSDSQVSIQLLDDEVKGEVRSNVDGDEGPAVPLEIKVHKEALKVLRPATEE